MVGGMSGGCRIRQSGIGFVRARRRPLAIAIINGSQWHEYIYTPCSICDRRADPNRTHPLYIYMEKGLSERGRVN